MEECCDTDCKSPVETCDRPNGELQEDTDSTALESDQQYIEDAKVSEDGSDLCDPDSESHPNRWCDECLIELCGCESQNYIEEALWQMCDDQNYIVNTLLQEMRADRIHAQKYHEKLLSLEVQSLEQTVFDLRARVLELEKENRYQKAVLTYREIKPGPHLCDNCQGKPDIPEPPHVNVLLRALNIPRVNMTSVGTQCDIKIQDHYYDGDVSLHSPGKTWFHGIAETSKSPGEKISVKFQSINGEVMKTEKRKGKTSKQTDLIAKESKIKRTAYDFQLINPSLSEISILKRSIEKLQKMDDSDSVPKFHDIKHNAKGKSTTTRKLNARETLREEKLQKKDDFVSVPKLHDIKHNGKSVTRHLNAQESEMKALVDVNVEIMPIIFTHGRTNSESTLNNSVEILADVNVVETNFQDCNYTSSSTFELQNKNITQLCKTTDDKSELSGATLREKKSLCTTIDYGMDDDFRTCDICIPHVLSGRSKTPRVVRVKRFNQLLNDIGINRHCTLENKLSKLISDPRYLHLNSSEERRTEFCNYVNRQRTNLVNNIAKIHRKYMIPKSFMKQCSTDDTNEGEFTQYINTAFGPVQSATSTGDHTSEDKNNKLIIHTIQGFKTEQNALISLLEKLDRSNCQTKDNIEEK